MHRTAIGLRSSIQRIRILEPNRPSKVMLNQDSPMDCGTIQLEEYYLLPEPFQRQYLSNQYELISCFSQQVQMTIF